MNASTPPFVAEPGKAGDVSKLLVPVSPIGPGTSVEEAAGLLLHPAFESLLCLPVVVGGEPVGVLSRHALNQIYLRRFGRELYGGRAVSRVMNTRPLVVDVEQSLEQAAQYISANIGKPITEDFVFVRNGAYVGMGVVLDLLGSLQQRVSSTHQQLAQAYAQLKASQARLVQTEKMASLGQMVAGVAHEINTPLGYVRNNVEMVQTVFEDVTATLAEHQTLTGMLADPQVNEKALGDQVRRCVEASDALRESQVIEDTRALFGDTLFGVDTIKELVLNLRNFSRLDQARAADVSINDCLEQTLVIAGTLWRDKLEVIRRYGDIPLLRCSPSQLNQVFLNLITNACQAVVPGKGKLLLKTEYDGQRVRIHVQDNGKGIAAENLSRIFDPFFTTKGVGQGTGLGLSISYQIVQAHGGTIQVASEPGSGTKFVISLPVDDHSAPPTVASIAP